MKKSFYKIISVVLCAVLLNIFIISSMSVKSYCAIDIIQDFSQEAGEISSAFLGFVWDSAVDVGHNFLQFLGLETVEEQAEYLNNHYIIDDPAPGQAGHVKIDDTLKDDMQDFIDDYRNNNQDFRYCYSIDFKRWSNAFVSRSRYQSILNLLNQYPNDLFVFYTYYSVTSDPTGTNDNNSIQQGGDRAIRIYRLSNEFASFVLNSDLSGFYSVYPYNDDWQKLKYSSSTVYGFARQGDTNLSIVGLPSYYDETIEWTAVNADKNAYPLGGGNGFWSPGGNTFYVIHSSPHGYPMYRTIDIMKQYSLGSQPYYVVPTNPNVVYDNGYYSVTTTQLDNSISYGDISSYVSNNNVTEYNLVNNYINNYYYNNGGGGSDSGSGGDSVGDIDWSWLGRIGEIIGGLISALGNVVVGIIDGISDLITSLTENLPNVFSSIIEWLLPFIPSEVTSLITLLFMAIIIVGVVRLIRGK